MLESTVFDLLPNRLGDPMLPSDVLVAVEGSDDTTVRGNDAEIATRLALADFVATLVFVPSSHNVDDGWCCGRWVAVPGELVFLPKVMLKWRD